MSTDNPEIVSPVDGVERLPSLAALQIVHKELLQAHRQEGDTAEFFDRIELFIAQGQATGSVLDEEQERWTAQGVLDYWSATLFRANRRAPDATLSDFDPALAPELLDELCPYVGLDPFRETTQGKYFGRERLVSTLIEKLSDGRLLAVVGPSGSGKSSVVLAGLLPALKRGVLPDSDAWRYVPSMVPGSNPLANLARLIQSVGVGAEEDPIEWAHEQESLLRKNPRHLLDLIDAAGDTPIVGVVDQFEEVFTLCNDQQARQAFIDNLTTLVQAPGARHAVIITMRSDFEPFVARMPNFYPLFEQALVRVTPLSASELREAIEKPAETVGLKFESGIVDLLLQDLLGEPAGLPLLQFTLLKLWERRARNRITWEAYNRLGSGRLALARSADAFFDNLIPEEQVTAKRIFLRLVRPGEGLEFTSNRVRLRTLYQAGEAQYRVDQVLDKLIAAHLLRVSEGDIAADTQVEVAHEALVRNWPRLVDWLEEERQNIRQRQGVGDAAERWIASGRDPGALYTTETVLQEALRVVEASGVALNESEAEFIRASQDVQQAARQEKEAARQRELALERRRADEQAAAARRFQRLAVVLAVMVIFALIASVVALSQTRAEREQRERAVAARMAAETGATRVAANLRIAQDALGAQIDVIDQLATSEAQKAAISIENQTLEALVAIVAPSPTSTRTSPTDTPRPSASAPSASPIGTSTSTAPPTAVGTQTTTATPTATPTRTATSTGTPGSTAAQSTTATAAALAALRSEVQATQTAVAMVSCGIREADLEQAMETCAFINVGWACYASSPVEVIPSDVRFSRPGDRLRLEVVTSIQTMGTDGLVVALVQLPFEAEPVMLIAAQNRLYVLSGDGRCAEMQPGSVLTGFGLGGLIINGVIIS